MVQKHWKATQERVEKFLSDTYFTDVNLRGRYFEPSGCEGGGGGGGLWWGGFSVGTLRMGVRATKGRGEFHGQYVTSDTGDTSWSVLLLS